jgi:hypothetical protein
MASVAQARPAPFPDNHWCPGQYWHGGWGNNWDWGRCHDDSWYDGDPHDVGHWHGPGGYPGGPGGPASYHWCPGQYWDGAGVITGTGGAATTSTTTTATLATQVTGTEVIQAGSR